MLWKQILLIGESLRFALWALKSNLLRTLLSLLGVTIGIFLVIFILTLVDGLDKSMKRSLSFIGEKVIYVQQFPWSFSPDYPWWKYIKRPLPSQDEYEYLQDNLEFASAVSLWEVKGGLTLAYKNNVVKNKAVMGVTYEHKEVASIPIDEGRYFTSFEIDRAQYVVIIGTDVAEEVFPGEEPIGKKLKINGISFSVIGLLEPQGENMFGAPSNDRICMIPYMALAKLFVKKGGLSPVIAIKGFPEDQGMKEIDAEVRGRLRMARGIRPKEEDNFALNRPEFLIEFFEGITDVLWIAGFVIGGFAMAIGGFGIANIMFVSVKERTSLIGIQKALGARRAFILWQFLFESVLLCMIGGLAGLGLVMPFSFLSTEIFEFTLSNKNIILGLSISVTIGILAGILPAARAAWMNPVEAIRS